jgi:hypothetical protein
VAEVPAAPADLWMDLQGQTFAQASTSAPAPANANTQRIAWTAVSGATSYNVYRSVNGGAESLYASGILRELNQIARQIEGSRTIDADRKAASLERINETRNSLARQVAPFEAMF